MIEQFTSPVAVNNSQEPWLVGEGVVVSGGVAIPSLDFDFITGGLPGTVTFTRASTATYFDSTGTLTTAAINEARFDYNPATLAARGLLIEEQRTNSIRNNTMQGAVAGTPGTPPTNWAGMPTSSNGLSRQIVGVGVESGINYIDIRYSGTTTSASVTGIRFEASTQIAAVSGQTWTNTAYVSLVGGSTANITAIDISIEEYSSAGVGLAFSNTTFIPTAGALATQRQTHTRTLNNASTAFVQPFVIFSYASGVAIDITLRIGLPQLELGAFATSVIPTTTTALTRSADVASVNTLSPWYNAAAGTLYAEAVTFDSLSGAFPRAFSVSDGTTNNAIQISRNNSTGNARMSVVSGGSAQAAADLTTWTLNATTKAALAYATNNFAGVANGGAVTTDTSGTVPTVSRLNLAADGSGVASQLNGYLRRITYYPRRLSNAELVSLTA